MKLSEKIKKLLKDVDEFYDNNSAVKYRLLKENIELDIPKVEQLEKENEKFKKGINEIYGLYTHPDYQADIKAITKICEQLLGKING